MHLNSVNVPADVAIPIHRFVKKMGPILSSIAFGSLAQPFHQVAHARHPILDSLSANGNGLFAGFGAARDLEVGLGYIQNLHRRKSVEGFTQSPTHQLDPGTRT